MNRVGIGWPGSGENLATAHGWYHLDWFGLILGSDGVGENVLRSGWEEHCTWYYLSEWRCYVDVNQDWPRVYVTIKRVCYFG